MMDIPTRDQLIQMIVDARAEWEAAISRLSAEEQEESLLDGWSVKDVIAHLMWHEKEIAGLVRARRLAGSDLWQRPLQERNRLIREQYRDLSLADIREQAANAYEALLKELAQLGEDELADAARWRDFPPNVLAWEIVAQNTYEHYRDHTADIERYLAGRAG